MKTPVKQSKTDYPFGMVMPGRSNSSSAYGYSFNGQEKTDEMMGQGNHIDFDERGYDTRTGRWWSVDKLFAQYQSLSPYSFTNNNPIYNIEVDGRYFTGNTASVKAVYALTSALAATGDKRAIAFKTVLEKMDASDVQFDIQNSTKPSWYVGTGIGGSTTFDLENNIVVIDVFNFSGGTEHPISKEGRTVHELAHGNQFLEGELSFIGDLPDPVFYDQTDEEKAYQIQNTITNSQLEIGEKPKTDEDAKKAANYPEDNPNESTISPEQAEKFKNSNQKRLTSIYNYKPKDKQKLEKKSILKSTNDGK